MAGPGDIENTGWQAGRCALDEDASLLFPPVYPDKETAKEAWLHVVRRDPHPGGIERWRWRLQDVLEHCQWLGCRTSSGMWQILDRLGIHYKRGRTYVHSPDAASEEKLVRIEALTRFVQAHPEEEVLLYQDECSLYRQPSVGSTYQAAGSDCPDARQARQLHNSIRLVGPWMP